MWRYLPIRVVIAPGELIAPGEIETHAGTRITRRGCVSPSQIFRASTTAKINFGLVGLDLCHDSVRLA